MPLLPSIEVARLQRTHPGIRQKIALEMQVSLPIPVRNGAIVRAKAFYYALSGLPPREDYDLYTPSWASEFDWSSGELISLNREDAAFFGLHGDRFTVLARISFASMSELAMRAKLPSVAERTKILFSLLDCLLPQFANSAMPDRHLADQYVVIFRTLEPGPLMSAYRALGADFFDWVGLG